MLITAIFSIFIISSYCQIDYFISAAPGCQSLCIGDLNVPYDNLWQALFEHSSEYANFVLINPPPGYNHMILANETPNTLTLTGNIEIKAFYCEDYPTLSNATNCIEEGRFLPLFIKSENLSIIVNGELYIEGIQFDGSENIGYLNSNPPVTPITNCTNNNSELCCQGGEIYSMYFPDIVCQATGVVIPNTQPYPGFFQINQSPVVYFWIASSVVTNWYPLNMESFFKIQSCTKFNIENLEYFNSFFSNGLISFTQTASQPINLEAGSPQFTNFNLRNYGPPLTQGQFFSGGLISNHEVILNDTIVKDINFKNMGFLQLNNGKNLTFINSEIFQVTNWESIIEASNTKVLIYNSKINFNKIYGPIISADIVDSITIAGNSLFRNNTVNTEGSVFTVTAVSGFIIMMNMIQNGNMMEFYSPTGAGAENVEILQNTISATNFDTQSGPRFLQGSNLQLSTWMVQSNTFTNAELADVSGFLNIEGTTFTNNIVNQTNFILNLASPQSGFNSCQIMNNQFQDETLFMNTESAIFSIINSTFQSNALGPQSAVINAQGQVLYLNNSEIFGHSSTPNSNSISIFGFRFFSISSQNLTIQGNSITSWAPNGINGEIVNLYGNQITLNNLKILGNTAYNGEGSSIFQCQANCNFDNLEVSQNNIQGYAVYLPRGNYEFHNTEINGNKVWAPPANVEYLVISVLRLANCFGVCKMNGVNASENNVEANGAILYFFLVTGVSETSNFHISSNTLSAQSGSAILTAFTKLQLGPGSIQFNKVMQNGALLQVSYNDEGTYSNINLENNQYEDYGTLLLIQPSGIIYFYSCNVQDFKSTIATPTDFVPKNALIANLEGGLYMHDSNFSFTPLIFCYTSNTELYNIVFHMEAIGDFSRQNIISYASLLIIENCEFLSSTTLVATNMQLFTTVGVQLRLVNNIFTNLTALEGSFFDFTQSSFTLVSTTFTNCHIGNFGDFLVSSHAELVNITGLLYLNDSFPRIRLSNVENFVITQATLTLQNQETYIMNLQNIESLNIETVSINIQSINSEYTLPYIISITDPYYNATLSTLSIFNAITTSGALYLGFLKTSNQPIIKILGSSFLNNQANGGGAAITTSLSNCTLEISGSTFSNNNAIKALKGGYGGSIYLYTRPKLSDSSTITINNCLFSGNNAEIFGGAVYVLGQQPVTPSWFNSSINTFTSNFAGGRPNDVGSNGAKLVLYMRDSSGQYNQEVGSGPFNDIAISSINIEQGLVFQIRDAFDEILYYDSNSLLTINSTNPSIIPNIKQIRAEKGWYNQTLSFTDAPGSIAIVTFTTNGITNFENAILNPIEFPSQVEVQFTFGSCGGGEIITPLNTCQICSPGSFLINLQENSHGPCENCNSEAQACYGGNLTYALSGYWQMNSTADLIIPCPVPSACISVPLSSGEDPEYVTECANGYEGRLCDTCINGWAKDRNGECFDCKQHSKQFVLACLGPALSVITISYAIYVELKQGRNYLRDKEAMDKDASQGILLRSLFNYLQIISLIGSIKVSWPNYFGFILSLNDYLAFTKINVANINCLYTNKEDFSIGPTYTQLIASNLSPLIFCAVAVLFWLIFFLCSRKSFKSREFVDKIMVSSMIICFTLQPGAINSNLKLFGCENLYRSDDPMYYLEIDYNIECWSLTHTKWTFGFAVPMIIFWALLLPAPIFIIMRRRRKYLQSPEMTKRFSFLYRGYKENIYFWEMLIFLRKYLLLIIVSMETFISGKMQLYLSLYVIWVAVTLQTKYNPYQIQMLNNLEALSLICAGIINSSGLYYKFVINTPTLSICMIAMAIISNFVFLITWIYQYVQMHRKKPFKRDKSLMRKIKREGFLAPSNFRRPEVFVNRRSHDFKGEKFFSKPNRKISRPGYEASPFLESQ